MKTTLTIWFGILCLSLLMSNCDKTDPLIGHVYTSTELRPDKLAAIQFFENGQVAIAFFPKNLSPYENESVYIWNKKCDVTSYRKEDNRIIISNDFKDMYECTIEKNKLNFSIIQAKDINITFEIDNRFTSIKRTNKYAGKAYECVQGIKLLFVSDDLIIYVENGNKLKLGSYKIIDDNAIIVKLPNSGIELIPDKETLKLSSFVGDLVFRKIDYQPTEFDIIEAIDRGANRNISYVN